MSKPNLFTYATSELSQDAFICWLLSWASPEYEKIDANLHHCAIKLIYAFFIKHELTEPEAIHDIYVNKQDSNIDVVCVINKKYIIMIEDKVGTKDHSNQLERYLNEIKSRDYESENIIPIYFKTEDQGCYWGVQSHGYKVFNRSDFLKVLDFYSGSNEILKDYREYLQSISDRVERYKSTSLENWDGWYSWVGFYLRLQKELSDGSWDYVSNPNGGFLGFWWYFQGNNICEQYLQLEQGKFCIKIRVRHPESRTEQRNRWHHIVKAKADELYPDLRLQRPQRFGHGEFMTICVLGREYRQCNADNTINIGETLKLIKQAEALLKSVVHENV